jgi:hypothetical protein
MPAIGAVGGLGSLGDKGASEAGRGEVADSEALPEAASPIDRLVFVQSLALV